MSYPTDQTYLLNDQYKTASNLNARIQLHARFSQNTYGWPRWVFDHINAAAESHILELGCGPAVLWRSNLDRLPTNWHITLSDFSPGMLQEAQQNLGEHRSSFTFRQIDAQSIPFPDASLDVVIANHMLYHVPDLSRALAEIRRVLKPQGHFYASTNGQNHFHEIDTLLQQIVPTANWWGDKSGYNRASRSFSLENGHSVLSHEFAQITLHRYEDVLLVTETEPLIAYILSGPIKSILVDEKLGAFRTLVEREIATHGAIHIAKDFGLFEAQKRSNKP